MKRALKLSLSLVLTVAFGAWAFRGVRWDELWASLRTAHYVWLIPYLAIWGAIHLCRTLRWGHLLARMERVPFSVLNPVAAISFMMLIVLPFRLGEFARPVLIAQRTRIGRSAAMTSVVLERIVDGMSMALLLQALVLFVPGTLSNARDLHLVHVAANLMLAIFGGGLAFLLFARWHHARAVGLVRATLGRLSSGAGEKVAAMVDQFVGALSQVPPPRDLALFFFYTLAYWGLNGLGMSVLSRAFDGLQLSLFQGYVLLCVLVVGVMIPAAPGMVGTFQAAVKLGLSLFLPALVVNGAGLAFANVLWLTQTLQQVGLGLVYLSAGHLSFRDLSRKLGEESPEPALQREGLESPESPS